MLFVRSAGGCPQPVWKLRCVSGNQAKSGMENTPMISQDGRRVHQGGRTMASTHHRQRKLGIETRTFAPKLCATAIISLYPIATIEFKLFYPYLRILLSMFYCYNWQLITNDYHTQYWWFSGVLSPNDDLSKTQTFNLSQNTTNICHVLTSQSRLFR